MKRIFNLPKLKLFAIGLMIMTAVSAVMILVGIFTIRKASVQLSNGLQSTEAALSSLQSEDRSDSAGSGTADKNHKKDDGKPIDTAISAKEKNDISSDSESEEDTSDAAQEQAITSGCAILSVFSPTEHRFAVYDGVTRDNLWLGVARVAESANVGDPGNCVILGHRDSAFRCLKNVAIGNKVSITTGQYEYIYRVEKTQVCKPEAPETTQAYDSAHLTLVTCYPFIYSGPSPERFLVICNLDSIKTLR
ncbi:MAG: sortase [Oscillospiraceae bacterium]